MQASFESAVVFTVSADRTAEFASGVRVLADCGADGARYATVTAAAYAADTGLTRVTVSPDGAGLTANLVGVLHGNDVPASLANHGHTGQADGGAVAHGTLSGAGTNSHATLDAFVASKGVAAGLASLDAVGLVVQNPANATATAAASKIPVADADGKLDSWLTDATTSAKGKVQLATASETVAGALATKAVTPSGLAAAAKGLIAANTTMYVATTGSDTTGDGSSGSPYASIAKALSSIAEKLIASGVTVTIQVADGTYAVSSTIVIDHLDADKIQILGNTSSKMTVAISAIDVDAKTITVAGDYTSYIQVGDTIALTGSSTSGLNGAYLVSGISYGDTSTVVKFSSETFASSTVGGGNIIINPCNKCVLRVTGSIGVNITKNLKLLNGFNISSSSLTGTGVQIGKNSVVTFGPGMIVSGFDVNILCQQGSILYINDLILKKCRLMMSSYSGGIIFTQSGSVVVLDSSTSFAAISSYNSLIRILSSAIFRLCAIESSPAFGTIGNNNSLVTIS